MIKEIIDKNTHTAFICDTFTDIQNFIDKCKEEGLIFSKCSSLKSFFPDDEHAELDFVEDYDYLFSRYTKHLNSEYRSYILIWNKGEYQFYARSEKDKDTYKDWDEYKFVNWTQYIREQRLNKLLD